MHSGNGPMKSEPGSVRKSFAEIMPVIKEIRNPDCRACPLHEEATNVCVMGRPGPIPRLWSIEAKVAPTIMLIGEAPGAREDKLNLPFVGRAGKRLQDALFYNEMERMVWITNICKCRPPRNRAPIGDEMDICAKLYLNREIELVRPVLIVLMGSVAASMYLQAFTRGEIVQLHEGAMMVVHHPSFFNHSGDEGAYRRFKEHLKTAKDYALRQTTITRLAPSTTELGYNSHSGPQGGPYSGMLEPKE
jgi:uracil-DNA glycosylase family 4